VVARSRVRACVRACARESSARIRICVHSREQRAHQDLRALARARAHQALRALARAARASGSACAPGSSTRIRLCVRSGEKHAHHAPRALRGEARTSRSACAPGRSTHITLEARGRPARRRVLAEGRRSRDTPCSLGVTCAVQPTRELLRWTTTLVEVALTSSSRVNAHGVIGLEGARHDRARVRRLTSGPDRTPPSAEGSHGALSTGPRHARLRRFTAPTRSQHDRSDAFTARSHGVPGALARTVHGAIELGRSWPIELGRSPRNRARSSRRHRARSFTAQSSSVVHGQSSSVVHGAIELGRSRRDRARSFTARSSSVVHGEIELGRSRRDRALSLTTRSSSVVHGAIDLCRPGAIELDVREAASADLRPRPDSRTHFAIRGTIALDRAQRDCTRPCAARSHSTV
jgi:hypothetical protein